ncbi:MAG: hypothetical protein FJW96_05785, partial [Actinobacteria bacterium]|nr:hypothetical protein [Actinomycetota bacterium]
MPPRPPSGVAAAWLVAALSVVAVAVAGRAALPQQAGTVDLLSQANLQINGAAAGDRAGLALASAGDVNGDGRADVIVGAYRADNRRRVDSGSAYVLFGRPTLRTVDLNALRGNGFRIDGAAAGDGAGFSVADAGDQNGDGRGDVIVGAPAARGTGAAFVVFGKKSSAPVDLAALGSAGYRIDGHRPGDSTGWSVASAGDLGGDRRPDLVIGAYRADGRSRVDAGSVFVVFGKASTRAVDLGRLGSRGFRIDGATAGDEAGRAVSGAGDVNGYGRP